MKLLVASHISIFVFLFTSSNLRAEPYSTGLIEANGYLYRKDYAKAEELFRKFIVRKELKREATMGLAAAFTARGKAPEAAALLSDLLENSPTDVGLLMQLSDTWMAQDQPVRAQKELARVRVLRPSQEGLEEKSAFVLAALGQKTEALKALEDIRVSNELSQQGHLALARMQFESGNLAQAQRTISSFSKKFSPTAESHLLMALALNAQKKTWEAEVAFRRAIQLEAAGATYWQAYGEFLQGQNRVAEGRKIMESALALDPENVNLQLKVAEAYELSEDYPAAEKAFTQILARSPGNDKAMYGIVRLVEARGAIDQVGVQLQRWVKAYPDKSWVVLSYARLLLAIGQPMLAQAALKESLSENSEQRDVQQLLAQLKNAPSAMESEAAPNSRGVASLGQTYIVKGGDLLTTISSKFYGTTKHWRRILDANRDLLKSAKDIKPGMNLKIPTIKDAKQPLKESEARRRGKKDESHALVVSESFSFRSAAPVKKSDSLLVSPDSVELPAMPPTPQSMSAESQSLSELVDSGFKFSIMAGPQREKIRLEGGGRTANLPFKFGYGVGAEIGYQLASIPLQFAANAYYSRVVFDGLVGVTPSTLVVRRKRGSILVKTRPGFAPNLQLHFGYMWTKREAEENRRTPVLVTNRNTGGLLFGAAYDYELFSNYRGESSLEVFLPHQHEEKAIITGNHRSSIAFEGATGIALSIGSGVVASLSLMARYEVNTFQGTGTRLSVNGKDTDVIFSLPLQLRF